jgi:hypothetical protein
MRRGLGDPEGCIVDLVEALRDSVWLLDPDGHGGTREERIKVWEQARTALAKVGDWSVFFSDPWPSEES